METVGRVCFPGENPEYQSELSRLVVDLDAYVARNAKGSTPAQRAEFKRQQGNVGTPASQLCEGDAVAMYRHMEKADIVTIRDGLARQLAKDGPPTWGTCL